MEENIEGESIKLGTTSPKDKQHSEYSSPVLPQAYLLCTSTFIIGASILQTILCHFLRGKYILASPQSCLA